MILDGRKIGLCVTGGIAAYKACEIVSSLKKLGADVFVVMTKNATEFVGKLTFETLSNNKVYSDMFDLNFNREVTHISLAKKVDLFLVAPATANFIGKLANGIADDFLTTTLMATKKPIIIAPAMNTGMLTSGAVQQNITVLKNRGVKFINSAVGNLACGDVGDGKLAPTAEIVDFICEFFNSKQNYKNKAVIVTCGSTIAPIDPVRFITNYSSGKMGFQIAKAAYERGAKIVFVYGNISDNIRNELQNYKDWKSVNVLTTDELYNAVMTNCSSVDSIIMAAAPSDYKIEKVFNSKIKSSDLTLNLKKNVDIAAEVGKIKGDKKLVIFAAETENLIENAKTKLASKNADMVVANDVTKEGAGFNVDTNIATIITNDKLTSLEKMSKAQMSNIILDMLLEI